MSAKRADAVIASARLVKAPDWSESRHWHVVAEDGTVLVVVAPSYGGISRSGRNGWRCWLADLGPSGSRDRWTTRQGAATAGLTAWKRWITAQA
jgi:hypothetical protein